MAERPDWLELNDVHGAHTVERLLNSENMRDEIRSLDDDGLERAMGLTQTYLSSPEFRRSQKIRASGLYEELIRRKIHKGDGNPLQSNSNRLNDELERIQDLSERWKRQERNGDDEDVDSNEGIRVWGTDEETPLIDNNLSAQRKKAIDDSEKKQLSRAFKGLMKDAYDVDLPRGFFVDDTFIGENYAVSGDLSIRVLKDGGKLGDIVYYSKKRGGAHGWPKGFKKNSIASSNFEYNTEKLRDAIRKKRYAPGSDSWGERFRGRQRGTLEETVIPGSGGAEVDSGAAGGGSGQTQTQAQIHRPPDERENTGFEWDTSHTSLAGGEGDGAETLLAGRNNINEEADDIIRDADDIEEVLEANAERLNVDLLQPDPGRHVEVIDGLDEAENEDVTTMAESADSYIDRNMSTVDNLARLRIRSASRELVSLRFRSKLAIEVMRNGRHTERAVGLGKAVFRSKRGLRAINERIDRYERDRHATPSMIAESYDMIVDDDGGNVVAEVGELRTKVRILEGKVNDQKRLERVRSWMKRNGIGLIGLTIGIGAIIATIVSVTRGVTVRTSNTLGKWGKALKKFADKVWPWLAPIFSALATIAGWGAKAVSWLADNLWMLAILIAVALFNTIYEKSRRRKRRR